MAEHNGSELYSLTSLQIRDMQSYVSRLFLLVANESSKLVFFVDNGPWTTKEHRSKPAELWQLMVTQLRVTQFDCERRRSSEEQSSIEILSKSSNQADRSLMNMRLPSSLSMIHLLKCVRGYCIALESRVSPFASRRRRSSEEQSSNGILSKSSNQADRSLMNMRLPSLSSMIHLLKCVWGCCIALQSRVSPFANRRRRSSEEQSRDDVSGASSSTGGGNGGGGFKLDQSAWSSFTTQLQQRFKALPLVKKSPDGLHGCVAFEVEWANVRGINYSNELQTDTCVALEVKTMVKREFDNRQQAQAWYASERCQPISQTHMFAAGASGDAGMGRHFNGPSEGCYGSVEDPPQSWAVDGSISSDEGSEDSDVTHEVSSTDDASDYGTVKSFGGISAYSGEEFSRRSLDFVTPPSSPKGTLCHCLGSWTCCGWCSGPREERSLTDIDQTSLGAMCNVQQDAYKGEEYLLDNEDNQCTIISTDIVESKENIEDDWGLFPSVSKGSFDMGRPPGAGHNGVCCGSSDCMWSEMQEGHVESRRLLESAHLLPEIEMQSDILIVFRFKEPLLPFELQQIVTADPGLLKMLESGLPSWVIFLQSYPIFCQLYRPWMRPLCGTIYYIVSVVTVLIGFYDLYKNVPILKATAARLCGPLFEWIEAWEMISRLKYLGTMLILQNFEKAFRWLFMTFRAIRRLSLLLMRPMVEPLAVLAEVVLPVWSMFLEVLLAFYGLISVITSSIFVTFSSIFNFIIWPFCVLLSGIWSLGVHPLLVAIWALLCLPLQIVRIILNVADSAIDGFIDIMQLIIASVSPAVSTFRSTKLATPAPSLWRALWNDIFSKVFRAIRSILNGLVAFLTACNRHRLSIYNEVVACLFRLGHMINSGRSAAVHTCQQLFLVPSPTALESKEKVEEHEEESRCSKEVLRLRRCISAQT